ncbi:hypothetical protein [Actinomadura violacea]|uniref:Uncharacterized protein n=1 Tax=Actinomadura violacea TaxID=2819934 RepID=A0ABS3RL32_9ACTN|nr:hypothetical protein [Actinomadura violacea]MBO2457278.1 hypothetical protein [Actinomadura violacea]
MERDDDEKSNPKAEGARNEYSGRDAERVVQVANVYGSMNVYSSNETPVAPLSTEELSEELRRAARAWRARFASVDFVNLPRVAMLSAGAAVTRAAEASGLDVTRPFHGQGVAPALFVGQARALFETWNADAVVLDESTVGKLPRGALVSFEASMRCVNPPAAPPEPPANRLSRDPHLVFPVGDHRVVVTFDPQWLTTSTAGGTLHDAAEQPQIYSGLGMVAAVSEDGRIRISALVFGQPTTAEVSLWDYIVASPDPLEQLTTADFRNELSISEEMPPDIDQQMKEMIVKRSSAVLIFNEDEVMPGDIDRDVLAQASRVVPEFRRDLRVAVASLIPPRTIRVDDITAHLLAREPALWKTFTVPGLSALIRSRNLAVATVSGLTQGQMADLDTVLKEETNTYLGGIELDRDLDMHRRLFPEHDRYHVLGGELRLVYSAQSRYTAEANGEDLDKPLNEWLGTGLFKSVAWEEDTDQSETEEREAAMMIEAFLRNQSR